MKSTATDKSQILRTRAIISVIAILTVASIAFANAATSSFTNTPVYGSNNSYVLVSASPDRSNPVELSGHTISEKSFIFVNQQDVNDAYFYLDSKLLDSQLSKSNATERETTAPYDLGNTKSNGTAGYRTLPPGSHNLRVVIIWNGGYTSLKKVSFNVAGSTTTSTTSTSTSTTSTTSSSTTSTSTTTSTTAQPPVTTVPPGISKAGYSLVWNDEFNSTVAAGATIPGWSYTTGSLSRDLGCYTKNNVSINGGSLHILTKAETTSCAAPDTNFSVGEVTSGTRVDPKTVPSGIIRIEMRAQMPDFTQNVWPGLWTRNGDYGGVYGEADLIEQWGDDQSYYGSDAVLVTTHNGCGGCNMLKGTFKTGVALDKSFNTYAVEIDTVKNEIRYYFGDSMTPISTHKASQYANGSAAQNNFITMLKGAWNAKLTMQIAEQNQWHDTANPATFRTTDLSIDYVRMYTKN